MILPPNHETFKVRQEARTTATDSLKNAYQNTDWYSSFEQLLYEILNLNLNDDLGFDYSKVQSVELKVLRVPVSTFTVNNNNQPIFRFIFNLVLSYLPDYEGNSKIKKLSFVTEKFDTTTDITDEVITSQLVEQVLDEYIFGGSVGFTRATKDTITLREIKPGQK